VRNALIRCRIVPLFQPVWPRRNGLLSRLSN
jgi:hypothetical protein